MSVGYGTTTNNARLNIIAALADAGAGAAIILIQGGVRPATGGALTNTLATLTMSTTAFTPAAAGVLTANTITGDLNAALSGTAVWFRITDSDGLFVLDGAVGTDLVFNPTGTITATGEVSIASLEIISGNI